MTFENFDCAVFLTWSNWHTEPRSNRFHYATRFALDLPVLFLQRTGKSLDHIELETIPDYNIEIVHVSEVMTHAQVEEFLELLHARGIKNPIYWIYDAHDYEELTDRSSKNFKVFHATEDYFTTSDAAAGLDQNRISEALKKNFHKFNLVVAVSDGVLKSLQELGGYSGHGIVIENGCDTTFFEQLNSNLVIDKASTKKIAIYQGGINSRLNYYLLHKVIHELPEWDFWFCGAEDASIKEWLILKGHPNVKYFGDLPPADVAKLMISSTVGIIPYNEDRWIKNSLPLKSFEYVACGLPVVSTEIEALKKYPSLFFLGDETNFSVKLEESSSKKFDKDYIVLRKEIANLKSYDQKYDYIKNFINKNFINKISLQNKLLPNKNSLNVVILYDDRWSHIGTVHEHLSSFKKYSSFNIFYVPATFSGQSGDPSTWNKLGYAVDLNIFDVVIVHYSVRLSLRKYFLEGFASQLENFSGLKILFIQDEYDTTEVARSWMDRLQFNIVYTCVPTVGLNFVYPQYRFPSTEFLPTLTGYVPEEMSIENHYIPMGDRKVRIGYRGRILSFYYGDLAREKYIIGVEVKKLALKHGLNVDIEVDDNKRIYGEDWYQFLGSVRGMLGTESGSNIFDFDGKVRSSVEALVSKNPTIAYEEVRKRLLQDHEGLVIMNQISPKIFEAIKLRTALILFVGDYSGVVKPDLHYIPLAKDFSNIDEVFEKLEDVKYLEEITNRAYKDIIASGLYSYENFVKNIDNDVLNRYFCESKYIIYSSPLIARDRYGVNRNISAKSAVGYSLGDRTLGSEFQREQVAEVMATDCKFEHVSIDVSTQVIEKSQPNVGRAQKARLLFVATYGGSKYYPFIRNVFWRLYSFIPRSIKDKIKNY